MTLLEERKVIAPNEMELKKHDQVIGCFEYSSQCLCVGTLL